MDFLLSVGSSNRTKRLTSPPPPSSKKELFLPNCLVLGHGTFPAFRLRHQLFLGLKAACQFSDWNLYCWLSRSSDLCSWTWTMSSILLGLQLANCRSLVYSHIINLSFSLSLIYVYWVDQDVHSDFSYERFGQSNIYTYIFFSIGSAFPESPAYLIYFMSH